jgi:hypothetical protein
MSVNNLVKVLLSTALVLLAGQVQAGAIRTDTAFEANIFGSNDDGSRYVGDIGFNYDFFGVTGNDLNINNNGNVTFDGALSTFTPFNLLTTGRKMLAPFFADVDTRGVGEDVTYGTSTVDGRTAFGVNWVDVAHYYMNGPLNSFQLVMIDRSDIGAGDFDFEFNYDQILWEAGTASGSDANGLGGNSARVGYTNGSTASLELAGSAVNGAFLDGGPAGTALIHNSLNSSVDGRYVFQVRNGIVEPVPEPATLILLVLGLLGLSATRLRNQ